MVRLGHALSPSWSRDVHSALNEADEGELRYRCFLGDLIFVVEGRDLSAPWGWVPLLDVALALESIVHALDVGHPAQQVFEFTESDATIAFTRRGERVEVEASYASGTVAVPWDELRREVDRFTRTLIDDLVALHPELARNPLIASRPGSG